MYGTEMRIAVYRPLREQAVLYLESTDVHQPDDGCVDQHEGQRIEKGGYTPHAALHDRQPVIFFGKDLSLCLFSAKGTDHTRTAKVFTHLAQNAIQTRLHPFVKRHAQ